MRIIIRYRYPYVSEVQRAHPIKVTDRARSGIQMETTGLHIGWSIDSSGRTLLPDGIIMMGALTLALVIVLTMRNNGNIK